MVVFILLFIQILVFKYIHSNKKLSPVIEYDIGYNAVQILLKYDLMKISVGWPDEIENGKTLFQESYVTRYVWNVVRKYVLKLLFVFF